MTFLPNNDEPDISTYGGRLKYLRRKLDLRQKGLGDLVHRDQSVISHFEDNSKRIDLDDIDVFRKVFSPDEMRWLLGLGLEHEHKENLEKDSIRWMEYIPSHITSEREYKPIEVGLQFFKDMVINNLDPNKIIGLDWYKERGYQDKQLIFRAFQLALRVGAFLITHVPRNKGLEDKLIEIARSTDGPVSNIIDVVVADVPDTYATLILAEFIAFLAAREVLTRVQNKISIGICSGYTALRLVENTVSTPALLDAEWIPMMSYPSQRVHRYSANHIALTAACRYSGTAQQMPYSAEGSTEFNTYIDKKVRSASMFFVSVNGVGRRTAPGSPQANEKTIRSADFFHHPNANELYQELAKRKIEDQFAGEMLGWMLNENAEICGGKQYQDEITQLNRERLAAVNIETLGSIANSGGNVWLLAARYYKAKPTLMAVENGLVNGLVIDRTIAEYLIEHLNPK